MIRRGLLGMALALAFSGSPAGAVEPAPFTTDGLARIKAKYAGRPFILSLWSVNECSYCIAELTLFGKLAKAHKDLPLVLVATDSREFSPAIEETLRQYGLGRIDSWVFDDAVPERLRAAIDPSWYGEVPRTYLYDARHQREPIVGMLGEQRLRAWLEQNRRRH
ncbi:MAG: TlpA family protein disulfide reductase [Thiobacillus sp.]|nr:TlpA family protein disulfide reductase [Thiobacillus sp.]